MEIREEPIAFVAELALMPSAFEVERVFDVSARDDGLGFVLSERKLDVPYLKNYDSITGGSPLEWATLFDMSEWGLLGAYLGSRRIGAAVVALETGSLHMFEGRNDLAVLGDIRVVPQARRAWRRFRGFPGCGSMGRCER